MTTASFNLVEDMLRSYARAPDLIDAAVRGLSREHLLARPIPGKWTMLELVAHLADTDQVYADRMKRVLAMEKPTLIGFPESDYVERLDYRSRDIDEELTLIRVTRLQMLRVLRAVPATAWDRQGIHNEAGPVSLRQLVQTMIDHVDYHLKFAADKRKKLGL
jgi:uncharacterized damage-inducible protein DinB